MHHLPDSILARHADLTAVRRDIHAHPELAFQENRTAELVASRLEKAGIEVHRGIGKTGVVGVLRHGQGSKAIALRADMDALPILEKNEFHHVSRHTGCMHACGHDGHTTMLLGAAEQLAAQVHAGQAEFDGTVVFIFQPAEEGEGGAPAMIEDGLFERFPVEAVFGMHNWPGLPVGEFAVHDGPVMASADRFDIVVRGHGAHAAMPHLGKDPLLAATQLVQALQSVVSRTRDPLDSAVLSVTCFQAGDAYNVIPEHAKLAGTVRTFSKRVQDQIEQRMQEICQGVGMATGTQIELTYHRGYPATINTSPEAHLCAQVAGKLVGKAHVQDKTNPSMGAEDFSWFLQEKPGCYVWIGNGPGEGGCTLHNPRYDFNDAVIPLGVAYWCKLVESRLN